MFVRMMIAGCLALGACGGKTESAPDGTGEAPAPTLDPAAVTAAQAKVPAGVAVTFEAVQGDKARLVAVQPKGWETGVIPGRVKPPMGSNLGFMTSFSTGTNCDGECAPKDWGAVVEKVEFASFGGKFDKDDKLPDGRLVVVKSGDRIDIVLARWKEGAEHYFVCRATLDRELVAAADAFEEACRQMQPLTWDH